MKTILFATGNPRKLAEATAAGGAFDIHVSAAHIEIDEIQSSDVDAVARHKVEAAFSWTRGPVVINDTAWNIPALRGFPGAYMKEVQHWFDAEDFARLMKGKNKRVCMAESIVYRDEKLSRVFTREYWGEFIDKPRGGGTSIEQIVAFNGVTIGEQHDRGLFLYDPKDYVWSDFAKWFADRLSR
jgi:inosine/xanthosine triphosphate pyrophosphatase family protein